MLPPKDVMHAHSDEMIREDLLLHICMHFTRNGKLVHDLKRTVLICTITPLFTSHFMA